MPRSEATSSYTVLSPFGGTARALKAVGVNRILSGIDPPSCISPEPSGHTGDTPNPGLTQTSADIHTRKTSVYKGFYDFGERSRMTTDAVHRIRNARVACSSHAGGTIAYILAVLCTSVSVHGIEALSPAGHDPHHTAISRNSLRPYPIRNAMDAATIPTNRVSSPERHHAISDQ